MIKSKIHITIDPFGCAVSNVVLSYQFVVIVWTNFHPIPTLFCVTSRLIHLWTFLEIPKISTFPIHQWKFLVNSNISTLLRITTFVEIFGKTENFHYSNASVEIFGESEYFHSTTNQCKQEIYQKLFVYTLNFNRYQCQTPFDDPTLKSFYNPSNH